MKRCLSAIALCLTLLFAASFILVKHTRARQDPLKVLLDMPAPPPPNPLWPGSGHRDEKFYDKRNPPSDDAPIEDLVDYWTRQSGEYSRLGWNVQPSERVLERLFDEAGRNKALMANILNVLPGGRRDADFVKDFYDRAITKGDLGREESGRIHQWLRMNSPAFSGELEPTASKAGNDREYVRSQEEILALTRTDFEKAKPIIDRLYNDPSQNGAGKVLGIWALYKHALETDSVGDVDRYRDELKAIVSNRNATPGMRDLALDALVRENDWPGRDAWYLSLLGDETLADLKVNGSHYTGLTTLMMYGPPEKYRDKMIELTSSTDPWVRTAAVNNLVVILSRDQSPETVKALLPLLEDPNWIKTDSQGGRAALLTVLSSKEVPGSAPGIIKMMDESSTRPSYVTNMNVAVPTTANTAGGSARNYVDREPASANAAVMIANVVGNATNAANRAPIAANETYFPYRSQAVTALATQKDMRAVPALRRVFAQSNEYERDMVVRALLACHGFSAQEQLDALVAALRQMPEGAVAGNVVMTPEFVTNTGIYVPGRASDIMSILGPQMLSLREADAELVKLAVERIQELDKKDPALSASLRKVMVNWQSDAVDALILGDLKEGKAEVEPIVRLLALRREIREKLPNEIYDLRSGAPTAVGISACLVEGEPEYNSILGGTNAESKIALLACGRLIRAQIPVKLAAAALQSENQMLKLAAERFLESEDSPQARSIVLSLHPGEAKILGATRCFEGSAAVSGIWYLSLFEDLKPNVSAFPNSPFLFYQQRCGSENPADKSEQKLRDEVKNTTSLLGIYAYDGNLVRIYADRVMLSWSDDASRYRERQLSRGEFEKLKDHFTRHNVDNLKPFLGCSANCESKELVMVGRNGGRRVYMQTDSKPEFFAGLENIFAEFKREPSTIRYELSKTLPGLEVLFADDDLHADTVWSRGADIRVLVSSEDAKKKVDREVEDSAVNDDETMDDGESAQNEGQVTDVGKIRAKREWEAYSWRSLGETLTPAAQPPGFERPPIRDDLPVQADEAQWKARAGDIEIRADENGLYKVARGKLTKLKDGYYESPLVTPNGRWVAAVKYDDDGPSPVRINLQTGKEFKVQSDYLPDVYPAAFVPSVNKILLTQRERSDEEYEGEIDEPSGAPAEPAETGLFWLDADTGIVTRATGELLPLGRQTFRSLQASSTPNELWAAIPGKDTMVGLLDVRTFRFKTVVKVPKITFGSMDMWVDEAAGKFYFVYHGHLLALPLKPNLR